MVYLYKADLLDSASAFFSILVGHPLNVSAEKYLRKYNLYAALFMYERIY